MAMTVNGVEKKGLPKAQDYSNDKYPSTSAKIRAMWKDGWSKGQIERSQICRTKDGRPIRYQHVRNVLLTPLAGDNG